ncbi:NlpC/P60 family protein [Streptomyces sp. NPDC051001]|uniref:C40 family peptidase n=1 Tax=Streptomyces sp. NPDC051001 TaxID=3155795 RepID=UPI003431F1B1
MRYAYWADVKLQRTAAAQYGATSDRAVSRSNLKPGDLLFWSHGGSGAVYHVAIYADDSNVLHAPRTGRTVSLALLTSAMPEGDCYGATRLPSSSPAPRIRPACQLRRAVAYVRGEVVEEGAGRSAEG